MFTVNWFIGAAMCVGSYFMIQPIARWWVKQHDASQLSLEEVQAMKREDQKAHQATQDALYKTGQTFGSIVAVAVFIAGIVVGNL